MFVITGATTQIGSMVAYTLLDRGKRIRVVGEFQENLVPYKLRGAQLCIGDQKDISFFTNALIPSDGLFLLIPPAKDASDQRAYFNAFGDEAIEAIRTAGVKKVVFLSNVTVADAEATAVVAGLHDVEEKLKALFNLDVGIVRTSLYTKSPPSKGQPITADKSSFSAPARVPLIELQAISRKIVELLVSAFRSGNVLIELPGESSSETKDPPVLEGGELPAASGGVRLAEVKPEPSGSVNSFAIFTQESLRPSDSKPA